MLPVLRQISQSTQFLEDTRFLHNRIYSQSALLHFKPKLRVRGMSQKVFKQTCSRLQIHPIIIIVVRIRMTTTSIPITAIISSLAVSLVIISSGRRYISFRHASELLQNLVQLLRIECLLSVLSLQSNKAMPLTITTGIVTANALTRCPSLRLGTGAGSRISVCVSWMCCCIACCIWPQALGLERDS